MGVLITVIILLTIGIVIGIAALKESEGGSILLIIVCLALGALISSEKTTSYDKPIEIPMSKISIMVDDEVAILRYGDVMETYDNVKEYKAIKDSSFKFIKTKERNVFGEDNGSTYELIIK
jgi:hypothetical protein